MIKTVYDVIGGIKEILCLYYLNKEDFIFQ